MFYESRNGFRFAGSTVAHDFEVSVKIMKWSVLALVLLFAVAMVNGCDSY